MSVKQRRQLKKKTERNTVTARILSILRNYVEGVKKITEFLN